MTINEKAVAFANSMRGKYIISQALYVAIMAMKQIPPHHREESNIADMQFLLDEMFTIYPAVAQAERTFAKTMKD